MTRKRLFFCVTLALFMTLFTQLLADVPAFKEDDRVAFIGDSITHGGRYHADVYLFYATRFPNKPYTAYNCGISGDTAPGTRLRFDNDIASKQPNVATIMLGMNDAWAHAFNTERPLQARLQDQANAYKSYTEAMDQIAARLTAMDCQIIFIKPSIYDQTAELPQKNLTGKNDLLGRFAQYIDTLARRYNGSVIDFHTPMSTLNHTLQTTNPSATIVSNDRVHPGVPGHFVMSYHFLKSQNMPQYVSAIRLDAAKGGKILQLDNCTIHNDLKVTTDTVSFTATEQALPFPISQTQLSALDWVPFQHDLNRQVLMIDNLPSGTYELTIDGMPVGQYASESIQAGIELSANTSTPQYQQSLAVKAAHEQQLQASKQLRTIAFVRHTILRKITPAIPETNHAVLAAELTKEIDKSKNKPWYAYLKQQAETFLELVPHEAEYQLQEAHWMQQMWITNQPVPHQWQLKRIEQ